MSAQASPDSLADFAGRHRGATIVVCGCGPSLEDLPVRPACISIGVNDVGRHFDPYYLVVVNLRRSSRPIASAQSRRAAASTSSTSARSAG